MYRCRDLPVYHCFFECTGYLIHADTDRRLHHSINKTGFPPDFTELAHAIGRVAIFYACGVLASFAQSKIMVYVTQGTLRNLRNDMFIHMEGLPIRYFDTHPHGDIMSTYTNDIDTLRQMISQSIPQLFSCSITIIGTFISMIVLSPQLTLLIIVMIFVMLKTVRKIGAQSGKYFIEQQKDLGKLNGYIEEMMEGQKVVKVFCHEQESLEQFKQINNKLRESANNANKIANITMPINGNIGNISYVLCALVGGCACVKRLFRTYNRYTCSISFIKQEFHTACNTDKPAGKQHCNGYGRCRQGI